MRAHTRLLPALLLHLGLALMLTVASMIVERTRLEVQDWDCPPAPASCARPVLVAGFPLPFVSDFHGISVVNSISLSGTLLGEDTFHATPFAGNIAFYMIVTYGIVTAFSLAKRRKSR